MSKEGYRPQQIVQQEAKPQGAPERQPLPRVLDVLERSVQAERAHWAGLEQKTLSEKMKSGRKYSEARRELAEEFARLSTEATGRERLIVEVYTTLSSYGDGVYRFGFLGMYETRNLIARVAPMSEDELREELRIAQEDREEHMQFYRRRQDTLRLHATLTPEELDQRRREEMRENARRYQQRRKERDRLRTEQQPKQVFPDRPKM